MSDKDLIRRGDAKGHPFANGMYDREHADKKFISGHECYKEWLDTVPAVPREMTAKELLLTEERMLQEDEDAYAEYTEFILSLKIGDAVAYAEEWAREHPERSGE